MNINNYSILEGFWASLYNGNISKMATAISGMTLLGKTYKYDELNRLVESIH